MKKYINIAFTVLLFITDMSLIYLSFNFAYKIRFYSNYFVNIFPPTKGIPDWAFYEQFFYLTIILWIFAFILVDFYKKKFISALDEVVLVLKGTTAATILIMATTFVYREFEFSRYVIAMIWPISSTLIYVWHEIGKYIYKLITARSHNVLILGGINEVEVIKKTIKKHDNIRPFFIFETKNQEELFSFIYSKKIDEVYVVASSLNLKELIKLADRCEERNVVLKIVPDLLQLRLGEILIDDSLGIPVFYLKSPSLAGINFYYKRVFDVLVSIFILSILFAPLLLISIFIIMDSPGSILYSHKRMGYRGRIFKFFKFRTMVQDAEKILGRIKHLTEREGPVFKMKNDPRITRIGKFLRRFSIDEFPQLLNVLRGEMSMVGPRPQVLWEAEAYDEWAKGRLRVLPGMTGLWQVSGRASLGYNEMIELDIYYIENWTLGLDLKILFKTIPAVFSRKGAY